MVFALHCIGTGALKRKRGAVTDVLKRGVLSGEKHGKTLVEDLGTRLITKASAVIRIELNLAA